MKKKVDILIVGAGPVGLLSAYLAQLSGLTTVIVDKSKAPLQVGRADALNARTLQLLEVVGLFDELYPLGKKCNTSSCLLYTSPSPRDATLSRMPSSA